MAANCSSLFLLRFDGCSGLLTVHLLYRYEAFVKRLARHANKEKGTTVAVRTSFADYAPTLSTRWDNKEDFIWFTPRLKYEYQARLGNAEDDAALATMVNGFFSKDKITSTGNETLANNALSLVRFA